MLFHMYSSDPRPGAYKVEPGPVVAGDLVSSARFVLLLLLLLVLLVCSTSIIIKPIPALALGPSGCSCHLLPSRRPSQPHATFCVCGFFAARPLKPESPAGVRSGLNKLPVSGNPKPFRTLHGETPQPFVTPQHHNHIIPPLCPSLSLWLAQDLGYTFNDDILCTFLHWSTCTEALWLCLAGLSPLLALIRTHLSTHIIVSCTPSQHHFLHEISTLHSRSSPTVSRSHPRSVLLLLAVLI